MSEVPEELTPMIRQYKRTCDDELVTALHLGKTLDYVESLKSEIERLETKNTWLMGALSLKNGDDL